jgi:hypothetical protein
VIVECGLTLRRVGNGCVKEISFSFLFIFIFVSVYNNFVTIFLVVAILINYCAFLYTVTVKNFVFCPSPLRHMHVIKCPPPHLLVSKVWVPCADHRISNSVPYIAALCIYLNNVAYFPENILEW